MDKKRLIFKWLLAIGIPVMTLSGCGSGPSEKSLPRKDAAIQAIEKIKSEKQLGLVEYDIRKIVKANDEGEWYKIGKRKILISCKAYLKAGIDLQAFNPMTDIAVDPDQTVIALTLPRPTLLSLDMPIDSATVEYEKTTWLRDDFSLAEMNNILRQGEEQIRASVPELGIIEDAERNARRFFEPLFKHMGFTSVQITFKDEQSN